MNSFFIILGVTIFDFIESAHTFGETAQKCRGGQGIKTPGLKPWR